MRTKPATKILNSIHAQQQVQTRYNRLLLNQLAAIFNITTKKTGK